MQLAIAAQVIESIFPLNPLKYYITHATKDIWGKHNELGILIVAKTSFCVVSII